MALSDKHQAFIDSYFLHHLNATEAYCDVYGTDRETGAARGSLLLRNVKVRAEIDRRLAEKTASADEILIGLTEQGRAKLGDFFKLVEEWTFYPLSTQEVLGEKEVDVLNDEGKPTGEKKVSYWVRHVVLDMDRVIDPKFSQLISEFSDSRDKGTKIKLYDKQTAWRDIAKMRGMITDKTDITSDGKPIQVTRIEVVIPNEEHTDDSAS